jgi:hypothetical protein
MGGGHECMGEFYRLDCFFEGGNPASVCSAIPNTSEVGSNVSLRYGQSKAEGLIYGEQAIKPICGPDCIFYEVRIEPLAYQLALHGG